MTVPARPVLQPPAARRRASHVRITAGDYLRATSKSNFPNCAADLAGTGGMFALSAVVFAVIEIEKYLARRGIIYD